MTMMLVWLMVTRVVCHTPERRSSGVDPASVAISQR